MEDAIWVCFFDGKQIERAGYDFPKGSVIKVSMPYDSRQPDNPYHPMVRLLRSMIATKAAKPLLELRGDPEAVQEVCEIAEDRWEEIYRKVLEMPKGFAVGWG